MAANFFIGGNDPLLGKTSTYPSQPLDYINEMQQQLDAYKQAMQQLPQQIGQLPPPPPTTVSTQQAASRSPIWDEIEKLTNELTDREFSLVNDNPDFQESQQAIATLITREQMRLLRPIVEGTKDGKEALEAHLALMKRLRKSVKQESDRNLELFNEYTEHYSDMPYSEFLKMKREGSAAKPIRKK